MRALILLSVATTVALLLPAASVRADGGRLRPPPEVRCARDDLTVYNGHVIGYRRSDDAIELTIDTDADTEESVRVPVSSSDRSNLLLRGQPFGADDFVRIERTASEPCPELRANAWVCSDGRTPPLVDFWPGAAEHGE